MLHKQLVLLKTRLDVYAAASIVHLINQDEYSLSNFPCLNVEI